MAKLDDEVFKVQVSEALDTQTKINEQTSKVLSGLNENDIHLLNLIKKLDERLKKLEGKN